MQEEESRGETWTSTKCTCGQQMMIYDAPRMRPKRSLSLSLVETWPVSTLPATGLQDMICRSTDQDLPNYQYA